MKCSPFRLLALLIISGTIATAAEPAVPPKFTTQFVEVEPGVKLEVVDWGGAGRPLLLLGGLWADAHVFDQLAPKLAPKYHVYGLTRRGFGASSHPASGYSSDRLGDDVLAVIAALKLDRPVLVGHSMAGMELSSVGSRSPEKIAGLIYLEAAYSYAFYDESSGDPMNLRLDAIELRAKLDQLLPGGRRDQKQLVAELLQGVRKLEKELLDFQARQKDQPDPPPEDLSQPPPAPPPAIRGIFAGLQKYTAIRTPVLAIYALPHALDDLGDGAALAKDPVAAAKAEAEDIAQAGSQAAAFEKGVPSAHVVRIAHASHFIFNSNEPDVLREMNLFLDRLP